LQACLNFFRRQHANVVAWHRHLALDGDGIFARRNAVDPIHASLVGPPAAGVPRKSGERSPIVGPADDTDAAGCLNREQPHCRIWQRLPSLIGDEPRHHAAEDHLDRDR